MKSHITLPASPFSELTDFQLAMCANISYLFAVQPASFNPDPSEVRIKDEVAQLRTFHPEAHYELLIWSICHMGASLDSFQDFIDRKLHSRGTVDLMAINHEMELAITFLAESARGELFHNTFSLDRLLALGVEYAGNDGLELKRRNLLYSISFRNDALALYSRIIAELHARGDESAGMEDFWVFRMDNIDVNAQDIGAYRGIHSFSYPQLVAFEHDQGVDSFRVPDNASIDPDRFISRLIPAHADIRGLVSNVLTLMGGIHDQYIEHGTKSRALSLLSYAASGVEPALTESDPLAVKKYSDLFGRFERHVETTLEYLNEIMRT